MNTRPSQLIGFYGFVAFLFDNAIWSFGTMLDNELEKQQGKTQKSTEVKRNIVLTRWLYDPGEKGRFKDPARSI